MNSRLGPSSVFCLIFTLTLVGCGGGSGSSSTPPPPSSYQLTVTAPAASTGTVTSSPTGINCPGTCAGSFSSGTNVTLTATPAANYTFSGWGGACSGTASCVVDMTAAESVNATFTATVTGSLQNLNHIIIFAQENRSFDHYFGYMRAYWAANNIPDQSFDGLPQFNPASGIAPLQGPAPSVPGCDPTNPNGSTVCTPDPSNPVTSFHMQSICTEELSPFWNESHVDWNDNFSYPNTIAEELNGFVESAGNDARQYYLPVNDINGYRAMGYFQDSDLNYYYFMASNFATSDRWFSPVMSRTQLNRMYMIGATSQGYAYPIGTDSADQSQITATPIFEELQNAGITWKVYVDASGTNCATETGDEQSECLLENYSYLNAFTYEETILNSAGQSPDLLQNIVPVTQFTTDAQNGTLPQVALIEPASTQELDEHPSDNDAFPVNIQDGAAYSAGLINTLMASQSWKDSAMIFTYDEFGGFYDHVPPQPAAVPDQFAYPVDLQPTDMCAGADQSSGVCSFAMTGYRVPMIVISPFAKANYVSHTVYDTTAVLALIEKRFGVAALTHRDAAQADMSTDFFNFTNPPWATPPANIPSQNTNGTCSTAAPTANVARPLHSSEVRR
jgi:phospholipase C